jgi:hypothetical protein
MPPSGQSKPVQEVNENHGIFYGHTDGD